MRSGEGGPWAADSVSEAMSAVPAATGQDPDRLLGRRPGELRLCVPSCPQCNPRRKRIPCPAASLLSGGSAAWP